MAYREAMGQTRTGRPRIHDRDQVLDRAVSLFWANGSAATTTRLLEDELGVGQSSLYNDFGSKDGLLEEAVARYEARLDEQVLSRLDEPGRESFLDFVDALLGWIGTDGHRGCLVMNLAAEAPAQHEWRMQRYRARLRQAVAASMETFSDVDVSARTELIVAAVFGLNLAARTGATHDELAAITGAIKDQVLSW